MKKLLFSTMGAALLSSVLFVSCGDNNGGGGTTPPVKGPNIEFQTNTGTFSGYTFTNESLPVSTGQSTTRVKIGVKISSDKNLKSTKMTVKYNSQAEVLIGTDSMISGKTCTRDYYFNLPMDKGTYTFTAYATDVDATTTTAKIIVTAYGQLTEVKTDMFYSLKATTAGHYSAYDLLNGEAITAASSAGNEASRDIVDMSTSTTLSKSWTSQNGTTFIISGIDGKLNGKTYTQFKSEQDILDAWNAVGGASGTINGVDDNKLIIAKSMQGGTPKYYMIAINAVTDNTGADEDTYEFHYQQ